MQKKKAVSLIVLVITVIVMIILAGAIIITLDNNGIINKANEAVSQSDLATVKQLAQLGWGEAFADGARTKEELQAGVDRLLAANNVDTTKYKIWVTTEGVTVKAKGEAATWVQDGTKVTNGKVTLQVGDKFLYDETLGGSITGLVDTDWQVLGANENGELLILSTKLVKDDLTLGHTTSAEANKDSWLNYKANLDAPCLAYGQGEDAVEARSIDIDDVLRVEKNISGNQQDITFKYNGTTTPDYTTSSGKSGKVPAGDILGDMHIIKGNRLTIINDLTTGKAGDIIATMTIKDYWGVVETSMFFGDKEYWLADEGLRFWCWFNESDQMLDARYIYYYMRARHAEFEFDSIANFDGLYNGTSTRAVRAVVALASDIIVSGNATTGWKY